MRDRLLTHRLAVPVLVITLFYAIWFFTGSSQRIRHLLPVYPVVLICLTVATQRWIAGTGHGKPAGAIVILVVLLQLTGHGVYAKNYAQYVFTGEPRDAFLRRTVLHFEAMDWINRNLSRHHKILITSRQLVYTAEIPVYYAHMAMESLVENHPKASDPAKFYDQMRRLGITHLLAKGSHPKNSGKGPTSGYLALKTSLARARCMEPMKVLYIDVGQSRTLPTLKRSKIQMTIFVLRPELCRL